MERKFLEELGIDKDIVNQIMSEYGKSIQDIQSKLSQVEQEKQQLQEENTTYQEAMEKFKDIDPDEMQKTIDELNQEIKSMSEKHAQDIADRDFNSFIDNGLNEVKARDVRAVKALLDIDALKGSNNQNEDFKKAIEDLKQNKSFLFESDEPIDNANVGESEDTPPTDIDEKQFKKVWGIKEK